jgi:excisionase family DNA binding protein
MPETIEAQPDAPTDAEYLSPDEAARRLGVAAKTVRAQLASGKLRGLKIGRVWRVQWPPQNS